jgi:hypothetical protein
VANYKGIEFAKDYNRSFADFKNELEHTHVFKNIPSAEREKALKEAYKIAVEDRVYEINIIDAKVEKLNGNTSGTITKSKIGKRTKH